MTQRKREKGQTTKY